MNFKFPLQYDRVINGMPKHIDVFSLTPSRFGSIELLDLVLIFLASLALIAHLALCIKGWSIIFFCSCRYSLILNP